MSIFDKWDKNVDTEGLQKDIAEAEAKAMKIKAESLKSNVDLIEYQKAISWDGKLPQTVLGSNPGVLMNLK